MTFSFQKNSGKHTYTRIYTCTWHFALCVCLHILHVCTLSLCMCTFPIMCMSSFCVVRDDCEITEGGQRGDCQHHGREEGTCVRQTPPVFLSSRVTASKHARRLPCLPLTCLINFTTQTQIINHTHARTPTYTLFYTSVEFLVLLFFSLL